MQTDNKHSIIKLLKKWLEGTARHEDESQLDAMAKDDPFVAEAMEGYRAFADKDHSKRIASIKKRLQNQDRQKSAVFFNLRRIAAAIALIIFAGGTFWVINTHFNQQEQAPISDATAPPKEKESKEETIADNKALDLSASKEIVSPEVEPSPSTPPPVPLAKKEEVTTQKNDELMSMEIKEVDAFIDEEVAEISKAEDTTISTDDLAVPATAERGKGAGVSRTEEVAADEAPAVLEIEEIEPKEHKDILLIQKRVISGIITAENGEPLIGATISVEGSDVGTVSGIDGKYRLILPEEGDELTIDYVGFNSIRSKIGKADTMNFVVTESLAQLEEVVVSAYDVRKKRDANSSSKAKSATTEAEQQVIATPKNGFKKYKRYIRRNLEYPLTAKDIKIEGTVQVDFTLDNIGTPIDFKILQSLGYGCDEEAIRLIKAGSGWKGIPGERVVYAIEFKL